MATRNQATRSALLSSAALMGQTVTTDTIDAQVTKLKEGQHGNVRPISRKDKQAIAKAAKAKRAAAAKSTKGKRTKRTQAVSATLEAQKGSVGLLLNTGDKLDTEVDKNCQAIVGEVAIAYVALQTNAGNGERPAAIEKMFKRTERQLDKPGNAFIRQLCDAWIGDKVQKPSNAKGNKSTMAAFNFYNARAQKIKRAVMVYIACRASSAGSATGAVELWNAKQGLLNVPLAVFKPALPPKTPPTELWTFSDALYQSTTHVLLSGASYDLTRAWGTGADRTSDRDGGAFTMRHLIDRFWSKPKYLSVAKQKAEGTTAAQGRDDPAANQLSDKQRRTAFGNADFWTLLPYVTKDIDTDAKPSIDDLKKHRQGLEQMRKVHLLYLDWSAKLQEIAAEANARKAAIAANRGKPFKMGAPVTDAPIATPTKGAPIVDAVPAPAPDITSIADAA